MWFKIPYKFSLQSMHKQKKYLGKTFFLGGGQAIPGIQAFTFNMINTTSHSQNC